MSGPRPLAAALLVCGGLLVVGSLVAPDGRTVRAGVLEEDGRDAARADRPPAGDRGGDDHAHDHAHDHGEPRAPRAGRVVELPARDLGTLVGRVVRDLELRVRNEDEVAWELASVRAECGCVQPASCTERVAPGEELVLRVRVDTEGQPGGPLERRVYAAFDPGPALVVAPVRAFLVPPPRVEPRVLTPRAGAGGGAFAGEAVLRVPGDATDVSAELAEAPSDVRVELGAPAARDDGLALPFVVAGALERGRDARALEVALRVVGGPHDGALVRVPVRARRGAGWRATPRSLVVVAGEGAAADVWVRSADGAPRGDLAWSSAPEGALEATWDALAGRLRVTPAPALGPGARATLRLADDEGGLQEVPVRLVPPPAPAGAVAR